MKLTRYTDLLFQHENLQQLYNDCMSQNKKLMEDMIQVKQQRDHAEKQMITKIQQFAEMQMDNEKKRKELLSQENKMQEEKKAIAQEQKKIKKLLSKADQTRKARNRAPRTSRNF